jgi:serine/threonine protein kinase
LRWIHWLRGAYEHQLGIMHHDIAPSNMLFDSQGAANLGDFGLAQVASASGSPQMACRSPSRHGTLHRAGAGGQRQK